MATLNPGLPMPGSIRVLHLVDRLRPGGMEYGVVKLVNRLAGGPVASSICSTRPATLTELVHPAVPVFELCRRDGNDPRLVSALWRLFRRERPDIVHTHAWGTLVEGWLAARLAGVPSLVHGEHGTLQLRPYQRRIQRRVWSWTDQVLSVSTRLSERMHASTGFPLERIYTIRNGVDADRFRPGRRTEARARLGLPADGLCVGTVGRLVPVKDHATLLKAVAGLQRQGIRPRVLIAGDGPLRQDLQSRAEGLGLAPHLWLAGHRADVEHILAALDVFVLSSVSEGLSNTILEAMATGLPVVATRVGGADELVEDGVTGFLVQPGAPDPMTLALQTLLADEATRTRMGEAARRRADEDFSLAAVVSRYQDLYLGLASRGSARSALPHAGAVAEVR